MLAACPVSMSARSSCGNERATRPRTCWPSGRVTDASDVPLTAKRVVATRPLAATKKPLALPFGPFLAWKRGDLYAACQRLFAAFAASLLVVVVVWFFVDGASVLAALGIGLSFWLFFGPLTDLALKSGVGKVSPGVALARFAGLPRSVFGTALAHIGLGMTVLGIVAVSSLEVERMAGLQPGETIEVSGYTLRFDGIQPFQGPNFTEDQGHFTYFDAAVREVGTVMSSKRLYTARQFPTTEAGLATHGLSQLYVALGDQLPDGSIVVRAWWKPLVLLIWLGTVVMMIGAGFSLADRRLRVGAPSQRKARPERPAAEVPA